MRNSDGCRSHCPINYFLESFGDSWSLLIVRDLMFKEKSSYGDFLSSDESISTNILADRLKRLEDHGIIVKTVCQENRSRFIYELTKKGSDLAAVMLEITAWSATYDTSTNTPGDFTDSFVKERKTMIEQVKKRLGR